VNFYILTGSPSRQTPVTSHVQAGGSLALFCSACVSFCSACVSPVACSGFTGASVGPCSFSEPFGFWSAESARGLGRGSVCRSWVPPSVGSVRRGAMPSDPRNGS
jgi:hypothetical protein